MHNPPVEIKPVLLRVNNAAGQQPKCDSLAGAVIDHIDLRAAAVDELHVVAIQAVDLRLENEAAMSGADEKIGGDGGMLLQQAVFGRWNAIGFLRTNGTARPASERQSVAHAAAGRSRQGR